MRLFKDLRLETKPILRVGLKILFGVSIVVLAYYAVGIISLLLNPWTSHEGPLSLDEALNMDKLRPLYSSKSTSDNNFAELSLTYYYTSSLAELIIDTYFTEQSSEGEAIRVARLSTYRNLVGSSKLMEKRSIIWRNKPTTGWLCEIPTQIAERDHISGKPYQTCLSWFDDNGDSFTLYTIWSTKKTEGFVGSLVEAGR